MPTFEIADGPTTIDASRSAEAMAVYSVTNISPESSDARLSVVLAGGSKTEWFSVDGNRERTFAAGESQTVVVKVKAPADAPAGDYPFRLRVVAVNDPDNDHTEGPTTIAKLGAAEVVGGKKSLLWLWILIGVLVVAAIVAAIFFMMRPNKPKVPPAGTTEATKPPPAVTAEPPKPAPAPAPRDRMVTGQALKGAASEAIVSANGYFRAVMQGDCNFVVYHTPRALWASGTHGRGSSCVAVMQGDGNLVVYNEGGGAVWASGTHGNPGAEVVMQDDGNLVVYNGGRALWASNTVVR